jgi:sec-independent protein translocase protein TatC
MDLPLTFMKKVFIFAWRIISAPFRGLYWLYTRAIAIIKFPFQGLRLFFTDTRESENKPVVEAFNTALDHPGLLLPHIDSVRKHVLRSMAAVILLSLLAFYFIKPILQFLANPLPGGLDALTAIDITENIGSVMKVALLCGFAVSIPYFAFEVFLFFAPAIKPSSRISGLLIIPLALIFFLAGMAFAYFIMLPVALPFLFDFMGLNTQPRPSSYFNFITAILFWIGLFFEFPLVSYLLARIGILPPRTLRDQWRLAVIIIAILAATITPTVDPINMGLVMGPMLILYVVAIIFTSFAHKRRQQTQ